MEEGKVTKLADPVESFGQVHEADLSGGTQTPCAVTIMNPFHFYCMLLGNRAVTLTCDCAAFYQNRNL